jgi:uncharacterized protein (TIGR03437 family)
MLRTLTPTLIIFLVLSVLIIINPRRVKSTSILRRLTNTTEQSINLNPSISDNGLAVAFESTSDLAGIGGNASFHTIRANFSPESLSFEDIGATRAVSPSLSIDGSKLAFASNEDLVGLNPDRNSEIYFADRQGLVQLTQTEPTNDSSRRVDGNLQPSITGDGQTIVFSSNRNFVGLNADLSSEIFLFDKTQGTFTQLTNNLDGLSAVWPKISADGSRVYFISLAENGARNLMLYDRAAVTTRLISENIPELSFTTGRAVSNDGMQLTYSAMTAENQTQVFLYDIRDNITHQLTRLGTRATDVNLQPTISGDGKRVAFATRRRVVVASDGSVELYLLDLPSGAVEEITNAPASATSEVVSSLNFDGSLVAFNFPRLLSGPVSDPELGNNSEIYLASLTPRPQFGAATVFNAAAKENAAGALVQVAPGSIASIKGSALALRTEATKLSGGDPPFMLAGTTVRVNGQPARILYVSPAEVVIVVPKGLSAGSADFVTTNADGFSSKGVATISPAAPGIFTVAGDGRGDAIILNSDTLMPAPLDPSDGQLRLTIFATGVANVSDVSLTVDGQGATVEAVMPAGLLGLDEIHVLLPAELRGAGKCTVIVSAGGVQSNPVSVVLAGSSLRDLMINEILSDPPDGPAGDTNHDGVRESSADEFIELVNSTERDLDLSGYQLQSRSINGTADVVRHRFASGTVLSAGTSIVVFGGGSPDAASPVFGGSQVVKASTGGLSLANSGGVVTIRNGSGAKVTSVTYGSATNQSLTRSPDISGSFSLHAVAPGSDGRSYSPGTRVGGDRFFATPAASAVTISPTFQELFTGNTTQFVARAFDRNNTELKDVIFSWTSTATSVLQIAANGQAKALAPGTASVTATARGVSSAASLVTVTQAASSPSPSPSPGPSVSPTPIPSPSSSPTPAPLVVISEFRTRGPSGASDEFVELYNKGDTDVDISGWKIKASSNAGTISNRLTIGAGTIIPGRKYFLMANLSGYSGAVPPDQTFTSGLVNDGGLAVTLANDAIVDQVGLSSGSAFREGMHLAPLPNDANQSYERKPGGALGSTQDTADNFVDFQLITPSDPQNRSSNPRPDPFPTPTPSPTATPTPSPAPSPSPSPIPTATPTPTPNQPVVISEFRTRGPSGASDEFVEIYNMSTEPLDISGWKIRSSSNTGVVTSRLSINSSTVIGGHSHFLAINSTDYSGAVSGDQSYTSGMANDGGLALTLPDDTIVDQVGFSSGSAFREGMHLAPLPSDANQSYERKPGGGIGSTKDTQDNFSDFQLLTPSDPQNSQSPPTPGPSPQPSPSPSPLPSPIPSPTPSPSKVVISQIFGGGGNSGALYRNDFIEIFNSGQTEVSLEGWSVQYASATATAWSVTNLTSVVLAPGQYYLIQEASGGSNGTALLADATGTIAMAAPSGKVALVKNTTALVGACPNDANIVDLVGYGSTVNCFEGMGPAATPSNTNSIRRIANGCSDTQNNAADFGTGTPNPRNTQSPFAACAIATIVMASIGDPH